MPDPTPPRRSGHPRVRTVAGIVAGTLMVGSGLFLLLQAYLDG